ncbi:DoxX family protein [Coralloluteibacterium stylophorae]|uniref:DoxX family protein n=1 Tax=Coralloluteibacterium stylophorae TaxID=1776034 RepID=A0A8J8AWZ1_9GAMM|nr:DoxX family protein [Coralloluteibacterium stylophorae]MBS7458122.1 DoxX family protein [Coralloluteibacterium stylophorae]
MRHVHTATYPVGRALLGLLFLVSGLGKIAGFDAVAGWMAAAGLPVAPALLVATIALETVAGAMLVLGVRPRWAAAALAVFLVPTTLLFHAFWNAGAESYQTELTSFLKNAAILGGMLLVLRQEATRTAPAKAG